MATSRPLNPSPSVPALKAYKSPRTSEGVGALLYEIFFESRLALARG